MHPITVIAPSLLLIAGSCCAMAEETNASPASPSDTTKVETITVKAERDTGYLTKDIQSATRTDTPIAQTPLSVQTVNAQVISDQGNVRLKDALRNVSGVAPSKTEGNGIQFETAYIRGFSQLTYVDGVQFYTMPTVDLIGVQRVDVLKGPASSMYGGMEPGGVINIVPKTAEFESSSSISGSFGSYDFYRAEAESTGAINNQLAYGLATSFQDNDSYRDFLHQRSEFVSPSLTWAPSKQTRITTYVWYQHLDRPQDQGNVFTFKGDPVGPISRNLAGPNNENNQHINDAVYSGGIEHDITSDLTVRVKALAHNFDGYTEAIRWNAVSAANTIAPYYDNSHFNDWQYDLVSDVNYRTEIGQTRHEFLAGLELNRNDYFYDRLVSAPLPAINIFNPVYPVGPFVTVPGFAEQRTLTNTVAGYLQDQMNALEDRCHLLVGGRVDRIDQRYTAFSNGNYYQQMDVGFSGRAGLMYDVTPWLSPYANVARSFNPNTAGQNITFTGEQLDPTTGTQYEGGIKTSAFEKKVSFTTAIYQITKNDVAIADPAHTGFNLNGGKLRSRGIEFDTAGQITAGLQIIGSYAHTGTEVLESSSLPIGGSFINIPQNSGSLWLNYTIQEGALHDLGVGVGTFAVSARPGDNGNTFNLPGYVRCDTGAWYTFPLTSGIKLKLQANVTNVLDKTYYETSSGAGSVQPGAPLIAIGKCSVIF